MGEESRVFVTTCARSVRSWVGKEFKDLRDIPEATREAIKPVLEAARSEAESAKTTAASALQTSQEVRTVAENAKQQLSGLKTEITNREAEVRSLGVEVQKSKAELQAQSKELKAVAQQVKAVGIEKNAQTVRKLYPLFGERYAAAEGYGPIDPSKKTAQDVYVFLALSLKVEGKQILDYKKVGEVVASLEERKYTVFQRSLLLISSTGQSEEALVRFGDQSCSLAEPPQTPPCILYFRQNLQKTAVEIRNMIQAAQTVPDDRIKLVDPAKMQTLPKELLEKSGIDVIVVLGKIE